jgi:hypothetical protein
VLVSHCFPVFPRRLVATKLRSMRNRGLIKPCQCGECSGHELTASRAARLTAGGHQLEWLHTEAVSVATKPDRKPPNRMWPKVGDRYLRLK